MADEHTLKTPEKPERIPKDDSFKTCETTMPSPGTRLRLRQTPARCSILSGGKPYKEGTPSKRKFNVRRKTNVSLQRSLSKSGNKSGQKLSETAGSNETFIRCEADAAFDPDSLELSNNINRRSSTPKCEVLSKQPTFLKEKKDSSNTNINGNDNDINNVNVNDNDIQHINKDDNHNGDRKDIQDITKTIENFKLPRLNPPRSARRPVVATKRKSPKKTLMPPPPPVLPRTGSESVARRFVTPKISFRKPTSLMGTTSRYLSQLNGSRIARSSSFKSTAELERDFFSSLRSF